MNICRRTCLRFLSYSQVYCRNSKFHLRGLSSIDEPDSRVDYSVEELLQNIQRQKTLRDPFKNKGDLFRDYSRKRTTAFSIDELVDFLRHNKAETICVIKNPPNTSYASHLVSCTGTGSRHITRLAKLLALEMKHVRILDGQRVRVEGKGNTTSNPPEWLIVDIGDSVVHFLTEEARSRYDMETLWALGHEYDDKVEEMISLNQEIGVFDTKVKK